jgi:hypothetical protein
MSCTWASAFRMMTSSARSAASAWSKPERSSRAPQPVQPRLAPLLEPPELQWDGAANPFLIAAGQLPAVDARWMTRSHRPSSCPP